MEIAGTVQRRPLILVSLLLAAFVINLDITIVNVALPTLVRELHASNSQLQWVVDAYNLLSAALRLAAGSLSDRLGRKGFLLAGLVVFGAASIAGGLTDTAGQLIVARCLMGLGAAMIFPTTLSLISNVYTERAERAKAIGLWGATAGIAIALGPIVGGWLLEQFSWTSIFIAMAPVAAVGAALVAWSVPTSRDPGANKTDRAGLVLSSAAMALLTYTLIEAPNYGWSIGRSLAGFAGAVGLFTAFSAWLPPASAETGSLALAGKMVVGGSGVGLFSAPATDAIVGVLPKPKAGVGSAVNGATRLLGSTLGVAVLGSVYASLYNSRLTDRLPADLAPRLARTAHESAGGALELANRTSVSGHPALAHTIHTAASSAFFDGF